MRPNDVKLAANRRSFLKTTLDRQCGSDLDPAVSRLGRRARDCVSASAPEIKPFELDEVTISDLQDGMKSGKFTAQSLVEKYSARIEEIDR